MTYLFFNIDTISNLSPNELQTLGFHPSRQQISETEASDSQIHSHNLGKKKNFLSGHSGVVPKLDFSVSSGS